MGCVRRTSLLRHGLSTSPSPSVRGFPFSFSLSREDKDVLCVQMLTYTHRLTSSLERRPCACSVLRAPARLLLEISVLGGQSFHPCSGMHGGWRWPCCRQVRAI
ncbi:hypothetical protein BS78_10G055400 [Paspalum vaginatum]|nr:hypothetical protein BS78_10G055400 [Paspalum vaginatum]